MKAALNHQGFTADKIQNVCKSCQDRWLLAATNERSGEWVEVMSSLSDRCAYFGV